MLIIDNNNSLNTEILQYIPTTSGMCRGISVCVCSICSHWWRAPISIIRYDIVILWYRYEQGILWYRFILAVNLHYCVKVNSWLFLQSQNLLTGYLLSILNSLLMGHQQAFHCFQARLGPRTFTPGPWENQEAVIWTSKPWKINPHSCNVIHSNRYVW